jgi:hypothetical protein
MKERRFRANAGTDNGLGCPALWRRDGVSAALPRDDPPSRSSWTARSSVTGVGACQPRCSNWSNPTAFPGNSSTRRIRLKANLSQLLLARNGSPTTIKGHRCVRLSVHPKNLAITAAVARASHALNYEVRFSDWNRKSTAPPDCRRRLAKFLSIPARLDPPPSQP